MSDRLVVVGLTRPPTTVARGERSLGVAGVLVVFATLAANVLVPGEWASRDPQIALSMFRFWNAAFNPPIPMGGDPWGRALCCQYTAGQGYSFYSSGPNGIDEHGLGDDLALLPAGHPRLALHRASGDIASFATLGLGIAVVLLVWRRALALMGRATIPFLAACSAASLAHAATWLLELVAPEALPPYQSPALVATAALGGAIVSLALTLSAASS